VGVEPVSCSCNSSVVRTTSNIVLVGFMGTGKSVVGKRLAERRGWRYIDTDDLVVGSAGCAISALFEQEGEGGFRDRETAAIRSLLGVEEAAVATGGGILGRDENVSLLRSIGPLICLKARPEVILERTRPWQDRPLLAASREPQATVERLLSERAPRYALADVTIDTSDLAVEEVVDEICRVYK
jgi:shikimate kinase